MILSAKYFCEDVPEYYVACADSLQSGMPEPVLIWTEDGDIKSCEKTQSEILESYESDFGKHAPEIDVPKIRLIWASLPSQLAKENKKFLYSTIKNGAGAREYENALNWLKNSNIVIKTSKITKPSLPITAYENLTAFKIYMNDVGLLRKYSHLAYSAFFAEYFTLF